MPSGLRRLLTWICVLFGALLVLVGVIDIAVGPESEALETGVDLADTASRWIGLIYVAIGAAIVGLALRIEHNAKGNTS